MCTMFILFLFSKSFVSHNPMAIWSHGLCAVMDFSLLSSALTVGILVSSSWL